MKYVSSTRVSRHINASRVRVYSALIDAEAVARWKVPSEMTCQVHAFEGREGGTDLVAVHDGLPSGVSTADNEAGWHEALARLAALVEGDA